MERKVEMLRQIPVNERRLLRKLQRNLQKMLNTEHVLITSRTFESRAGARLGTLLRVAQFIREEVDGSAGNRNATATTAATEQTLARFEMVSKELVLVADPADGLRRLGDKLRGLPIDYCRLRELRVKDSDALPVPFETESMLDATLQLFYACGVDELDTFARTRHESLRQIGHSFRRLTEEEEVDPVPDGEVASILAGEITPIRRYSEEDEAKDDATEVDEEEDEDEDEADEEDEEEQGEGFYNSSTTADDGTIAELTMP